MAGPIADRVLEAQRMEKARQDRVAKDFDPRQPRNPHTGEWIKIGSISDVKLGDTVKFRIENAGAGSKHGVGVYSGPAGSKGFHHVEALPGTELNPKTARHPHGKYTELTLHSSNFVERKPQKAVDHVGPLSADHPNVMFYGGDRVNVYRKNKDGTYQVRHESGMARTVRAGELSKEPTGRPVSPRQLGIPDAGGNRLWTGDAVTITGKTESTSLDGQKGVVVDGHGDRVTVQIGTTKHIVSNLQVKKPGGDEENDISPEEQLDRVKEKLDQPGRLGFKQRQELEDRKLELEKQISAESRKTPPLSGKALREHSANVEFELERRAYEEAKKEHADALRQAREAGEKTKRAHNADNAPERAELKVLEGRKLDLGGATSAQEKRMLADVEHRIRNLRAAIGSPS